VITRQTVRGTGLGRVLMKEALARSDALWPGQPVRIGAQHRLEKFYQSLGFTTASDVYIEDGIPHIEMLRTGTTK
jgi:ElaA protein